MFYYVVVKKTKHNKDHEFFSKFIQDEHLFLKCFMNIGDARDTVNQITNLKLSTPEEMYYSSYDGVFDDMTIKGIREKKPTNWLLVQIIENECMVRSTEEKS